MGSIDRRNKVKGIKEKRRREEEGEEGKIKDTICLPERRKFESTNFSSIITGSPSDLTRSMSASVYLLYIVNY